MKRFPIFTSISAWKEQRNAGRCDRLAKKGTIMVVVLLAELLLSGHGIVTSKRILPPDSTVSVDSHDDNALPSSVARVRAAVFQMQEDVTSCLEASSAGSRKAYVLRVQQDERDFRLTVKRMCDWGDVWYSHSLVDSIFEGLESFRVNCSIAVQMVQQRPIANARRSLLMGIESYSKSTLAQMNDLVSLRDKRKPPTITLLQTESYATLFQMLLFLPLAAIGCRYAFTRVRTRLVRPKSRQVQSTMIKEDLKESPVSVDVRTYSEVSTDVKTETPNPEPKHELATTNSRRKAKRKVHRAQSVRGKSRLEGRPGFLPLNSQCQ